MWEVRVKVTMSVLEEVERWIEEGEELVSKEWSDEKAAATLKVKIDHTGEDAEGRYLPDDEITADAVSEAFEEWKRLTGLSENDETEINYYYEPERAKWLN
mgnify:CR=1 FL=1